MTVTLTISENGSIVLPATLRQRWGMMPASQVIAEEAEHGVLLKPADSAPLRNSVPLEERLVLLRQAQGIWKDRDDLPNFATLRAETDRF